jgi:lipopolysaccharide transport system ATP-binding protein
MSRTIIEVENISKLYKLGSIGTGTLTHDLNRWWHKMRKKEDPYAAVASQNDKTQKSDDGYIWSLKDVSFDINEGEVFGIIGKNGSGKSTLLKILSKITKPTKGEIRIDGRIASLLEVGTGFHPELTGRENVFLNGAILGMRKNEIKKRFDAIVDFSGIERYIDTPVKKYSSGMYVRLAFSVAAHLEPDILVIDEVLAVGDGEFQEKCLGKMEDVSKNQGRTVLFVSHSIAAVKQLCTKGLLLEDGLKKMSGPMDEVLNIYQHQEADTTDGKRGNLPLNTPGYFTDWQLDNNEFQNKHTCFTGDTCTFSFGFKATELLKNCEIRFSLKYKGFLILNTSNLVNNGSAFSISPGHYYFKFKIHLPVRDAQLDVDATFLSLGKPIDSWVSSTPLNVLTNYTTHLYSGLIEPDVEFSINKEIAELTS